MSTRRRRGGFTVSYMLREIAKATNTTQEVVWAGAIEKANALLLSPYVWPPKEPFDMRGNADRGPCDHVWEAHSPGIEDCRLCGDRNRYPGVRR